MHWFTLSSHTHSLVFSVLTCTQVETIGDAYMVVSGLPEKSETHADSVATFALEMIDVMSSIENPVTKTALQIRVGR